MSANASTTQVPALNIVLGADAPVPLSHENPTPIVVDDSPPTSNATASGGQHASDIIDERGRCKTCHCTPGRTGVRVPSRYGIRLSPRHHPRNSPPTHNYRGDRLPHPDELKAPPEVSGMKAFHMAVPVGVKAGILTFWVDVSSPWPFWMEPGWHESFETARYLYCSEYNAGYAALLVITPYDPTKTLSGPRYPPGLPQPRSAAKPSSSDRLAGPSGTGVPVVLLPAVSIPQNGAKSAAEVNSAIRSLVAPPSAASAANAAASSSTTKNTPSSSALPATAAASATATAGSASSAPLRTAAIPQPPAAAPSVTAAPGLLPSRILAALDAGTLDLPPKRKRALDPYRPGGEFYFPTHPLSPLAFEPTPPPGARDDDDYQPASPSPRPGTQTTLSPYLGLSAASSPLSFPSPTPVSPYVSPAPSRAKKGKGKAVATRPRRTAKESAKAAISSRVAQEMEENSPTPPKKQRVATSSRATPQVKAESSPESLFTSDSSPEAPRMAPFIDAQPPTPMDQDFESTIHGASSLSASTISSVSTHAVIDLSDDEINTSRNSTPAHPPPAASSIHSFTTLTPRPKKKKAGR